MIRQSLFKLRISCLNLQGFFFSQKKFSKLIINADEYLKDSRFDSDVKSEWAKKQSEFEKEQVSKKDTRKQLDEQLKEAEEDFQEAASILRSFKEKIRVDETSNIEQAMDNQSKDFLHLTKMHFEGQNDQVTKDRAKRFKDQLRLRQDWSPTAHLTPKISDNYANYTHFQKTYPTLKDKLSNETPSKENKREFMKNVDPRSKEKIENERKVMDKFENVFEKEERKINKKQERKLNDRKEMFPGSDPLPATSSEFFNRNPFKRTISRDLMEKDQVSILQAKNEREREDADTNLPKGVIKRKRFQLEDEEQANQAAMEAYEEGREDMDKSRVGGLAGEDDFADLIEGQKDQKKQDDMKLGGLGGGVKGSASNKNDFSSGFDLEYHSLIRKLHWERDCIDEEVDEESERSRDDWGPFKRKNQGNLFKRKFKGRVSPWAKEEILRLHLDGWSIRDISLRYGIIPERVKAIVWCRKTFYDEVFPRIELSTVKLGLEREMTYGEKFTWIDFGKDIEIMIQRERGVPVMDFKNHNKTIDTKAEEEVQRRMEKYLEFKQKKKQDRVTEGFIGTGNKSYFLKSWIVYKGHGSERVTRSFKKAVHFSDRPSRLCKNILKRIKQGPRYAARGYGIK